MIIPEISDRDHVLGDLSSGLVLLEYGDFECPYCGDAFPKIKKIKASLGKDLAFAFRNFPLRNSHPHAFDAAISAEAAARQGRFWEMHDALFQSQDDLTMENILVLGKGIGLDIPRFKKDIRLPEIRKKVEDDFLSGIRSGVNGTPTFFINEERYDGEVDEMHGYLSRMISG